ncbi:MAG: EAL domain-containing protein [bacterium]
MKVIAEGVDSLNDLTWFQKRNVDYLQGFYFAKPDSPPPKVDKTRVS